LSTIAVHVEDAVARVTLERPDKRNAINDDMRAELTAAFAAFDADSSIRVVVLTGAGSAFCAGGDLSASTAPDPHRPRIVEPLDQFSFDTTTHVGVFDSSLKAGTLAVKSGQIVKQTPEAMHIKTPGALLGVRGTEFVVRADGGGS